MRIAHVRETYAPAGGPWRLAAALPDGRWLDLERARRTLVREDPRRAHNDPLFREPLSSLDEFLFRGRRRVEALHEILDPFIADLTRLPPPDKDEDSELALVAGDLRFGPPILRPTSLRDFYAFEAHVRTAWQRRNQEIPEAWYRIPVFYFSNVSEMRGTGDPVWAPDASGELDYELEVAALIDTPARDLSPERAEEAVGGYTILNDWSARDLQREETTVRLGPAKGKDFATSIGPWLVTPDELADTRSGKGFAVAMTADVNGTEMGRGTWADIHFSFGEMLARACADVSLRPGDLVGSGTVGGGCLLETKDETLGRYLVPGDDVVLRVERLGELATPVTARPTS